MAFGSESVEERWQVHFILSSQTILRRYYIFGGGYYSSSIKRRIFEIINSDLSTLFLGCIYLF